MFKTKHRPKYLKIPKTLSVLYSLLLFLFSLDVFKENMPFFDRLIHFLIQIVPVFILSAITLTAWSYPKIGGLLFIFSGLAITFLFDTYIKLTLFLSSSLILILIGGLFILFGILDDTY